MTSAQKQAAGFLGLCMRAGRIVSGQEAAVDLARAQKAAIILVDEEVSANTMKRVTDTCRTHNVPAYLMEAGLIGRSIGRDSAMVIALRRDSMAEKLLSIFQNESRL